MRLKPILNKIVVKPHDPIKETAGGLIIPTAKNDGIIQGEVLAVGPGAYDDKGNFVTVNVSVGSTVIYNVLSGEKFELDEEEYVLLTEQDLVGILSW